MLYIEKATKIACSWKLGSWRSICTVWNTVKTSAEASKILQWLMISQKMTAIWQDESQFTANQKITTYFLISCYSLPYNSSKIIFKSVIRIFSKFCSLYEFNINFDIRIKVIPVFEVFYGRQKLTACNITRQTCSKSSERRGYTWYS